ncbi:hypothetical protein HDV00_000305 [Rhizophlyctis rosea]|nr:hypothetical protein HDV00_000305 [Rhizophlyctis rosea]
MLAQSDGVAPKYKQVDFDSQDDYTAFNTASRNRALEVLKLAMNLNPGDSFMWVARRVNGVLKSQPMSPDALGTCIQALPKGLINDPQNQLGQQLLPLIINLAEVIVALDLNTPNTISTQLSVLCDFGEILQLNPPLLMKCLEKIFAFAIMEIPIDEVDQLAPTLQTSPDRKATLTLRQRAAGALIKFGAAMPDFLMGMYESIVASVYRMAEERHLSFVAVLGLREFLITIIYNASSPTPETKAKLINAELDMYISQCAQFPDEHLSSPERFLQYLGFDELSALAPTLAACKSPQQLDPTAVKTLLAIKERRGYFSGMLNALWTLARRTIDLKQPGKSRANAWGVHLRTILPKVLACIRAFHWAWDTSVWRRYPKELVRAFEITAQERAIAPGMDNNDDEPADSTSMLDSQPLIINCPPELLPQSLGPILPTTFELIIGKLELGWKVLLASDMGMKAEEDIDEEGVSDEIVSERLLRDATRNWADLLIAIFQIPEKGGSKDVAAMETAAAKPVFNHPELMNYLLSAETAAPVMKSVLDLITIKDTSTSGKVLKLCLKITPVFAQWAQFHAFLGRDMLMKAIEALHDGYLVACHTDAISLISHIYNTIRPISDIPYQTMFGIPGMDATALANFEVEFQSKATMKEKTAVVKVFLRGIQGLAISEWGKQKESFILNQTEKQLLTKPSADSSAAELLDRESGDPGISALFE